MKKLLLLFLLFSWAGSPIWAADPPKLNGQWAGLLQVPGGKLKLIITLVPLSNGSYYAALDAPQQRISRMPATATVKGADITVSIEQAGSRFVGKVLKNGATLQGTWSQPGLKGSLTLTRLAAPKPAAVAGKPRLTKPYREEEVSFYNKQAQLRLAGTLTTPAGPGPFPAVVLLSDSGPHDRDVTEQDYRLFGSLADQLTRRGIAVLRFDDRGVGQSQGSHFNTTTADVVSDAQAALLFLRTRRLLDARYLGLLGHGEGANVALLAAAEPAPATAPAFVVALAPYGVPGRDIIQRQQLEIMRLIGSNPAQVKAALALNQEMIRIIRQTPNDNQARGKVAGLLRYHNTDLDPHMARARAVQLTSPWSRYFLDFDPVRTLPAVKCPVLLLGGTTDLQVATSQNLPPLKKGLRNSATTALRLPGVNHWFQPEMKDWPVVNGEQQPVFSPKALTEIREWVFSKTERPQPVATGAGEPLKKQLVKGSGGKVSR
ncbi:alpha/beta hydrolase [Hymenobacter sp. ISL-91]|uniref:alpha/beta hydrolase family protein n=1 Tax=Hymenobacter sp. ISL-91 TaxID=2819151 RepID=UPI001BE8E464|nr:alpha/beta hydrolase [Hymenobacter sp. ISL-91]MBT2557847.1 alpha/beta hydrolase [Hymenobacter sp. ISL-91]